ncbi:globin-coupled sensor protein [Erythrobacter sp.]|jgi:methyl-accepting chemotaxis protein|uniref:globin-coupled sensor protein n=1 Tax=Erythrobacter sp. TaxID=1042 RepID=UPI002EB542CC|nr:globin-coupled sensor protein [Erythrobacter sp.]
MSNTQLSERIDHYRLDQNDKSAFKAVSRALDRAINPALQRFYKVVGGRPKLAAFFDNGGKMDRAKRLQAEHWQAVFRDGVDEEFHKRAQRIGAVHARIGLEPAWYVGGYALVLEDIITELVAPGWTRALPWRRTKAKEVVTLVKVSLLDIDLALSTYFVDSAEKAETMNRMVGEVLSQVARGDLTVRLSGVPEEFRGLESDFNSATAELNSSMSAVINGVDALRTGSGEIRSASDDLARRTEEQAASLEETAAAIADATERIQQTVGTTSTARDTIGDATRKAEDGSKIVAEAVSAMDQIEKSSEEINNIISVIESIAFQTNLLALNAGVEAARAGETGKGFAVVASEVRALAQRCSEAAEEVKSLITASSEQVGSGVDLVKRSGEAFSAITQGVNELAQSIETIADATQAQAESLTQINTVVGDLDRSTQQNAAMSEECTAAATSLSQEAETLGDAVSGFTTDDNADHEGEQRQTRLAA